VVLVTAQTGTSTSATIPAAVPGTLALSPIGAVVPTIRWSSQTFPGAVSLVAVTGSAGAIGGFGAGSIALDLLFATGATPLNAFSAPLEITFTGAGALFTPAYSTDGGATWIGIPLLASSSLPDGQADGYFIGAEGDVHLVTRHATTFGLLRGLVVKIGGRRVVRAGTKRLAVFVATGRAATAAVTLVDPRGRVVYRQQRSLAAGTTRLVLPLPRRAIAGLYTVKVVAKAGPVAGTVRFQVRLSTKARK